MFFKNVPILPKILPSKTLDSIPRRSLPHLSCDRYAKATTIEVVFYGICDKITIVKPFPVISQTQKRRSSLKSVALGKGLP
jgi:hypothetical protein